MENEYKLSDKEQAVGDKPTMSSWTETDYEIEKLMDITIYYRLYGKYANQLKELVE